MIVVMAIIIIIIIAVLHDEVQVHVRIAAKKMKLLQGHDKLIQRLEQLQVCTAKAVTLVATAGTVLDARAVAADRGSELIPRWWSLSLLSLSPSLSSWSYRMMKYRAT